MKELPEPDDLSAKVIDGCTMDYNFRDRGTEDWQVRVPNVDVEHEYDPMMNTLWPLPDDFEVPDDAEERLDNMTIVQVFDGPARGLHLALTGGGMDMSWPIARTYVNFGLLPPATLGRLPEMGGMDFDAPENRVVADALQKSHSLIIGRHDRDIDEIESLGQ